MDRTLERVLGRIDVGDCWVWTGYLTRNGYGQTWADGRTFAVHRYVYESLVGQIPEGLEIDHLCRNKACANPDHLEVVTRQINVRRAPTNHRCGHSDWYTYPATGKRTCHSCKRERQIRYNQKRRRRG